MLSTSTKTRLVGTFDHNLDPSENELTKLRDAISYPFPVSYLLAIVMTHTIKLMTTWHIYSLILSQIDAT